MFKKRYIILILIVAIGFISVGLSSWIIIHETRLHPKFDDTHPLAVYYLNNQEVFYSGVSQHPIPSSDIESTYNITYSYKKGNTVDYTNGSPIDAGEYNIKIESSDFEPLYVTYIIKKMPLSISNVIELDYLDTLTSWGDMAKIDGFKEFTFQDINSQAVSLQKDVAYYVDGMTNGAYYYGTLDSSLISGQKNATTVSTKNIIGSTYAVYFRLIGNYANNYILNNNHVILKYKTAKVGTTYYTIEDALAQSGEIELLGNDTSFISTSFCALDYTIYNYNSSATNNITAHTYSLSKKLKVPFADVSLDFHGSGGQTEVSGSSNGCDPIAVTAKNIVYSYLYIPKDIVLNVNSSGSLVVGALIASSGTVQNRGVVLNDGKINLESGASIAAYGYLKGNGSIDMKSGSKITDVFRIFDWQGGKNSAGLNTAKIFPINAYSVHNVSCEVKILPGSTYDAFWNIQFSNTLYKGFQRGDENGNIVIVGTNGMFNITTGYVLKSAIPASLWPNDTNLSTITGTNQKLGQKEKIDIYGNCNDGNVSIKITASGTSFTMKTSAEMAIPIPYMDISVKSIGTSTTGSLTLNHSSYKFMPGSTLTVDENSEVNINNINVLFYSVNECITDEQKRPTPFIKSSGGNCIDRIDASVTVNGTLNVQSSGSIGGKIITNVGDSKGKVLIAGSSDCGVSYITSSKEGFLGLTTDFTTKTRYYSSNLRLYNGNIIENKFSNIASGNYYSIEASGETGWYSETAKIYYDLNGGTSEPISPSDNKTIGENGYIISENDVNKYPTRNHYTFNGWYLDRNGTNLALGSKIFASVNLYAIWNANEYTLKYEYIYHSSIPSSKYEVNPENSVYTADTIETLGNPNSLNGNVFGGWYISASHSSEDRITILDGTKYVDQGELTIYGYWYPEGTETYTVKFEIQNKTDNNELITVSPELQIVNLDAQGLEIPSLSIKTDNDSTYGYYFDGWYLDEGYGTKYDSQVGITESCILYGKWEKKRLFKLSIEGGTEYSYYVIPEEKIKLPSKETESSIETIVWFTDNNWTSKTLFVGGKEYNISLFDNIEKLYGEKYNLIIDNNNINSLPSDYKTKSKVLFDGITFNETLSISVEITTGSLVSQIESQTSSRFAQMNAKKIVLNDCNLKKANLGETYAKTERKPLFADKCYALAYNGLFNKCNQLETVVIAGTTVLCAQTFSNCNVLSNIYVSGSALDDITKYKPTDVLGKEITTDPSVAL